MQLEFLQPQFFQFLFLGRELSRAQLFETVIVAVMLFDEPTVLVVVLEQLSR
jgi:hypothetical protein